MSHIIERDSEYSHDREAHRINQSTMTLSHKTSVLSQGSGFMAGIKKLWNQPSDYNLDDRKDSLIFADDEVDPVKESKPSDLQLSFALGRNDTQKSSFSDRFVSEANNQRRKTTHMGK